MISGKRVNICLYSSLIFWDVSSFSWVERKLGTNKKRLIEGLRGKDRLCTLHLKCLLYFRITKINKQQFLKETKAGAAVWYSVKNFGL